MGTIRGARGIGILVAGLVATFLVVAPVSASSATSWRATIVGATLRGGATTLIQSDSTGSINVKLSGVTPGDVVAILVNPTACPDEAQDVFSFELPAASADGVAAGRHTLSAREARAYNDALTRRTRLSLLAVSADDKGCGDQVGAPSVGTARVQDSKTVQGTTIYTYDLRYPVIGGIGAAAATAINATVKARVDAIIADLLDRARGAGPNDGPIGLLSQTFSVRLSQSGLLSISFAFSDASGPDSTDFPYALTFDTTTGRQLTLDDVVRTDPAAMATLQADVRQVLAPRGRLYQSQAIISDESPWHLESTGLEFIFATLGAIGAPPYPALVPWSRLRPILNFQSPVARLAGSGPCQASQLASTIDDWEGGVGSRFTTVHLTNYSAAACFLQGTPQSQVIDGTGRVLIDSARQGADGLPHVSPGDPRITVNPGARAEIDVQTNNYCGPAPVGAIRVALRLPSSPDRVISPQAPDAFLDDLPPCNGSVGQGVIVTNGWRRG